MMRWFRFGKKRKDPALPGLSLEENPIRTELHNHLVPGVDDGVDTLDETLTVLRQYEAWGYERVVITPHVMSGYYPNTEADLLEKADEIRRAAEADGLSIQVRVAAEYFLDETLVERAKKGPLLTLGGAFLLVETDFMQRPMDFERNIFELQVRGYQIVLAHPERYAYLHRDPSQYDDLRTRGIRFQVNLFSMVGHYGDAVYHFARRLIKKGDVDFIGSDLHGPRHLPVMEKALTSPLYREAVGKNIQNNQLLWD